MTRDSRKLVSEETLISLFKEKIVACDSRMFKSLRIKGFDVIVRLFVLVNELEGNVQDLEQKSENIYWGGNYNYGGHNSHYKYNQSESRNKFNRFRVHIMPFNLIGIEVLWHMMNAVDSGANNMLFAMVTRTLINIYSNLSSLLSEKVNEVSDAFLSRVIECLKTISENKFVNRTPE